MIAVDRNTKERKPGRLRAQRMARTDRARQICDCAVGILARQGIGHSNHSEVAKAAGVALPTLFYHYPDHASLTRAVLERVSHFLLETIGSSAVADGPGGLAGIERILMKLARSLDENRELVTIWLDWSTARSSDAWPDYLAFHVSAEGLVYPLIEQVKTAGDAASDLDTASAARVVVGMAHMVAQMNLTARPLAEIEAAVHRLTQGYFTAR